MRPTKKTGNSAARLRDSSAISFRSRAMMRAGTIMTRTSSADASPTRARYTSSSGRSSPLTDRIGAPARTSARTIAGVPASTSCRANVRTLPSIAVTSLAPASLGESRRSAGVAGDRDLHARPEQAMAQLARARHGKKSPAQHSDTIGDPLGLVQVVRRNNHGVPSRSELEHHVAHQPRALRIEA